MERDDLQARLEAFCRDRLDDPGAKVLSIEPGGGHAGFSYLFDVESQGSVRRLFMRLPPPGVEWRGTADVLRQVAALNALKGTTVPHGPVLWSGDDLEWFGCPYFIQERIDGDVLRGDFLLAFTDEQCTAMAQQAMAALAGIHRVELGPATEYLGAFNGFEDDVTRWDRFYERAAEPEALSRQPEARAKLLANIPSGTRVGLFHGDFQWANLMFSSEAQLQAVIDWELTGIGATLNDLGWICAFNDPRAWPADRARNRMPQGDELEAMYREAWGGDPGDVRWFKALAMYKFGIISGFNLMLHRRGKRHDPHWEDMIPSMKTNMDYAADLLS